MQPPTKNILYQHFTSQMLSLKWVKNIIDRQCLLPEVKKVYNICPKSWISFDCRKRILTRKRNENLRENVLKTTMQQVRWYHSLNPRKGRIDVTPQVAVPTTLPLVIARRWQLPRYFSHLEKRNMVILTQVLQHNSSKNKCFAKFKYFDWQWIVMDGPFRRAAKNAVK